MGADYACSHAAALVAQLPTGSRLSKAADPDAAWSDETHLLAMIEYDLRVLIWQRTKDAQQGRNRPKPIKTPSEQAREERRAQGFDKALVDRVLGGGGEADAD